VGAADLFVLRRVSAGRFVHLGGAGRAEGWAGIVEISLEDEEAISRALKSGEIVRLAAESGKELVFGPYYARGAAIVPIGADTVVVFGAADGTIEADAESLGAAANAAVEIVGPAGPAKELADQLELLEAVRAAAAVSSSPVEQAMEALAGIAAESLSCELGVLYLVDGDRIAVAERGWTLATPRDEVARSLATVVETHAFPYCVQNAKTSPPPGILSSELGIRSYYLLELTGLASGVLLVAHTDAAPRGFTLLCRRLGARVADVASSVLAAGITREWTSGEAVRLQTAFAELER
jgi:hypothetical protein